MTTENNPNCCSDDLSNTIKKYRKYLNSRPIIKMWQLLSLAQRGYKIKKYIETNNIRKLQLGSGENVINGWLNTDLIPLDFRVLFLDVTNRFPFEDGIFDYIYSEHMIEHVPYEKGYIVLQECYRILKPGGVIRIATPDLNFLIELFRNDKMNIQEEYIKWAADTYFPHININSETFVINNFFYNWEHQFIYDFNVFKKTLENIGFVNVIRCQSGESNYKILNGLERHDTVIPKRFNYLETMVLEGEKRI